MKLEVQGEWFDLLYSGQKTVEGRTGDGSKYTIGEPITISRGDERFQMILQGIRSYPDLDSYLAAEWKKAAPQCRSIRKAKDAYLSVHAPKCGQVFAAERIALRGGIVALELRLQKRRLADS